jgi:hypothetical protein
MKTIIYNTLLTLCFGMMENYTWKLKQIVRLDQGWAEK